ncbi:MAG: deoxynucleoside kinase [Saprospiraceae bacterium]
MNKSFPHPYIAIEGNIGAGKTTFCKMLQEDFGFKIILEQFTDNPFLPFFYEHPERYAFPVELFFMTERHKQLQEDLSQGELFSQTIISDYFFLKTLLFAKSNLMDEEFRLFQRLFSVLNNTFRKPDLLVYLHRPVEDLQKNIQNRGRDMEQKIPDAYLQKIQQAYFEYFKNEQQLPIIIMNLEDVKFWENKVAYQDMVEALHQNYPPGITRMNFDRQTGKIETSGV